MCNITRKLPQDFNIPVAIVVPEAQPWLPAQVVKDIKDWWVSTKQPSLLGFHFLFITLPEMLQEIHVFWNPMPPREYLI
jgi:hypothetical protein